MRTISKPPDDPNHGKNRVPSLFELKTLRALHEKNCQEVGYLDSKLNAAKLDHEYIERRYQDKLLEIDCIKSELNASYRFISILEYHRAALDEENEELKGLIHPIRRYPDDILQLIFEWAVCLDCDEWFKTATAISQVCKAPLQETRRLFEIGLQRLRSTLPSIVLTDLDDSEDGDGLRVFTNECNLKRFSSIDSLTFELSSSFDVSMFARNILRYSPGSLRELSVTAPEWEGTEEPWNILSLTRNFSTVKEITLFRCSTMFVHHSSPFASLKTLRLSEMNISLERSDFSLLVELEELAIDDICCEDTPAGDMITLESLLKIEVAGDCSTILKFLRAPRLKMVDASIFEDHEIQFICNHPTIRHLGIRDYGGTKDNTLKALATCLLSLEFLQIYSGFEDLIDWRAVGLTSQPFPKLNRIKYALSQHDPIPWKHLERLMEYRCRFNTMDPQIDALTEWTLVCPRGKTQEVYSEGPRKLIRECTFFEEDFDDSIRLCLSWSNGRKKTIVTR